VITLIKGVGFFQGLGVYVECGQVAFLLSRKVSLSSCGIEKGKIQAKTGFCMRAKILALEQNGN
jgi:hypothetical protein